MIDTSVRVQREERRRMRSETLANYALGVQRLAIAMGTMLVSGALAHALNLATRSPF